MGLFPSSLPRSSTRKDSPMVLFFSLSSSALDFFPQPAFFSRDCDICCIGKAEGVWCVLVIVLVAVQGVVLIVAYFYCCYRSCCKLLSNLTLALVNIAKTSQYPAQIIPFNSIQILNSYSLGNLTWRALK